MAVISGIVGLALFYPVWRCFAGIAEQMKGPWIPPGQFRHPPNPQFAFALFLTGLALAGIALCALCLATEMFMDANGIKS